MTTFKICGKRATVRARKRVVIVTGNVFVTQNVSTVASAAISRKPVYAMADTLTAIVISIPAFVHVTHVVGINVFVDSSLTESNAMATRCPKTVARAI